MGDVSDSLLIVQTLHSPSFDVATYNKPPAYVDPRISVHVATYDVEI
jgi:hypothetical protein